MMRLVPIGRDALGPTAEIWYPFVENIAKKQKCHVEQRLHEIYNGTVHLLVVWDEDKRAAKALVGLSFMQRGNDKIARILWLTGESREQWLSLNDELESLCRAAGCKGMEAIARPGWSKELKRFGYRMTHCQYEKDF